jgi:UDP-glucose 4-epimerase
LNAIITGSTGFIGSVLCNEILDHGGKVAAIVRKDSVHLSRLPQHPNLILVEGSMDNVPGWKNNLENMGINFDVFFHMAWDGVDNQSRNSLVQFNNINPSVETQYLAKELGCRKWVGAGSQAEYGPLNKKINETDVTLPTTFYGAAKLAVSHTSRIVGSQLGLSTVWVRIFSTFGPGDNGGWLLTDLISQLLKNEKLKLTKGEQLWDYLYVSDAASAFYSLANNQNTDGIYNIGSGQSYTIRSVVETVRNLIDPSIELTFGETPYRPDQVMHLEANIDKIKSDTGWLPSVDLTQGLTKTIEYFKNNF